MDGIHFLQTLFLYLDKHMTAIGGFDRYYGIFADMLLWPFWESIFIMISVKPYGVYYGTRDLQMCQRILLYLINIHWLSVDFDWLRPRAILPASGEQIVMSPSLKGNNCILLTR